MSWIKKAIKKFWYQKFHFSQSIDKIISLLYYLLKDIFQIKYCEEQNKL